MRKRRAANRLELSRETLRQLTQEELKLPAGAITGTCLRPQSICVCQTDNCPRNTI
jgi:hypothetical protein